MASRWNSRVSIIFLFCFPELLLSAVVTLDSLEIYTTHEWLTSTPTVYFKCNEEKKTLLPDVKKAHAVYHFKGEESFQPLTNFTSKKCKRCGFYEKDRIKFDDVFDEWEFCPSDFTSPNGIYIHSKDKEFNATFLCDECVKRVDNLDGDSHHHNEGHGVQWYIVIIVVSIVGSILLMMGVFVAYKYWLKRKRQQDQARFLKLFEEEDDIEDDLGLGPLSDSI
ncbi:uncharacterized protein LOC111887552 isoform X2 [Lactuca sativa]|uniref:uncharacterized protein LOC111887552 isoform X2 n=1 Tax=Lactuca sativa TaxID=4236 RepID=UPI000CAC98F6|nr:uncharacterized protein LOC111887552 isoform X2 [Lactuca sativa]